MVDIWAANFKEFILTGQAFKKHRSTLNVK